MLVVVPGLEEAVQDVVGVRRHDQVLDGQTHALGIVAGQNVAEVARRDAEADGAVALREQLVVGVEVVGDLEHDPRPVDRVHGSQAVLLLEVQVPEEPFHNVLAIVKGALHCDAMNVGVQNTGHLLLLDLRHAPLGEENEAFDVLLAAHAVDGRAAGVAAGRPQDSQAPGVALEEVLVEVAERLQCNVLEGKGRPVEQLHDVHVAHLHGRHRLCVRESAVAALHEALEV
mmetsp:Transcript_89112/g.279133  ORF Transcript_89112/g.279133 Transcript_89112/m.279133 type:complete len:229 (+) Transcript_89112:836-1522(+)